MRLILPATDAAVRRGLQTIKHGLEPNGLAADEVASLEIVLAEILNNIVEHAYADHPEGLIDIRLSQADDGLHFLISDRGNMMPGGEPPLGLQANLNCDIADLPEGGFGWFLIRELAHELRYAHVDGENKLSFRMAIGQKR
ncbi:ATP-binding protein [Celeribacter sp. HF31]|uniref:ATP-binding protein n=1 Tax=Celeribacter sp. HF31 TaxID=2721558 RepID=UPI0020CA7E7B|nr:ATP-binding protein [Celeribacter sp. HF31]